MARLKIPKRFYVIDRSGSGTVSVRNPRTGRFRGRSKVNNKGDMTYVRRITRDFDIDHDGKIDPVGGWIIGRTTKVKASGRAKGHIRGL